MDHDEAINKLRRRLQTLRKSISLAKPELGAAWMGMIDRTLSATENIDSPAPSLTPDLAKLLTDALEAAFDCANEVAQTTHTIYAGYKPHRHAAVDADVRLISRAQEALKVVVTPGGS